LSYRPRSSLSAKVLAWLADRPAHLTPPRAPGLGGNPPLALEVRLNAVGAVILRGGRGRWARHAGATPRRMDQPEDAVRRQAAHSHRDRGFRGIAKPRGHWHAPVGDRRTKDRLTGEQRAFNRVQAGLRALVEQAIGHLANAWALRRWRGLLYRVGQVYRTAGALVCLTRWLYRVLRMTEHHGHPQWSGLPGALLPLTCAQGRR
jgi:hypothetical protein